MIENAKRIRMFYKNNYKHFSFAFKTVNNKNKQLLLINSTARDNYYIWRLYKLIRSCDEFYIGKTIVELSKLDTNSVFREINY